MLNRKSNSNPTLTPYQIEHRADAIRLQAIVAKWNENGFRDMLHLMFTNCIEFAEIMPNDTIELSEFYLDMNFITDYIKKNFAE